MKTQYTLCLCFLVLASVGSAQQQSTGYPAWYANGPTSTDFLPPEYTGQHPSRVATQFQTGAAHARASNARVWGSTESGVLAITNMTVHPVGRISWDTGFARVHSVSRIGSKTDQPNNFLLCVWDAAAGRSRLLKLSVASSGLVSQAPIGPMSSANKLWSAATFIGDQVFLYEAQDSEIRRIVDMNADGVIDTLDSSYVVDVPQDSSVDKTAIHTRWISGFKRNAQGEVAVYSGNSSRALISDNGIIPPFLTNAAPRNTDLIRLGNGLVPGQRSVFVFGSPGTEFTVYKRGPEDQFIAISKKWTVPPDQSIVVELSAALAANDRVSVIPTDGQEVGRSFEWKVESTNSALLFEIPLKRKANQGASFRLFGDGFSPTHRVHYRSALGSGILQTTFRSRTRLDVQLPAMGSGNGSPPYTKGTWTRIWIVDVSGGPALTTPRMVKIRHD